VRHPHIHREAPLRLWAHLEQRRLELRLTWREVARRAGVPGCVLTYLKYGRNIGIDHGDKLHAWLGDFRVVGRRAEPLSIMFAASKYAAARRLPAPS
jgi:hypothetical protein